MLLVRELRARGFVLEVGRLVLKRLARRKPGGIPASGWLLTNGERVEWVADPDVVLAFLAQRRVPHFVLVPLAAIQDKIADARLRGMGQARVEASVMRRPPQPVAFADWSARRLQA